MYLSIVEIVKILADCDKVFLPVKLRFNVIFIKELVKVSYLFKHFLDLCLFFVGILFVVVKKILNYRLKAFYQFLLLQLILLLLLVILFHIFVLLIYSPLL